MRRLAAVTAATFAFAAATAPAAPLENEGRWIIDAAGRVVVLHGWNLVSKTGRFRPEDTGFGRDDARFLRRHGFNTIRLGVIYKALEPRPPGPGGKPRYRDGYLASIERTQRLLARHGIHTVLDFHQDLYNERFQGEGWPDWQVVDDGLPSEPKAGFPANYVVNLGLQRAFDNFWANTPVRGVGLQDRYASAWRHVARRFRDVPGLAGYNIINEPWPGTLYPTCISPLGCPLFDTLTLERFSKRVIAQIRRVDRRALVWYSPNVLFDFGADTQHGDTGDDRAGFAFNMYCLLGGFLPANPLGDATCSATYGLTLDNAERQSRQTDDALLMTEFAATNDLDVVAEIVQLADERMLSWQQWHYCECDDPTTAGGGVQSIVVDPRKPPRGENLNRGKLRVSSRPYPQAVAGTPRAWSFDPKAGRFELRYLTSRADSDKPLPRRLTTDVFIPPAHYRGGYRARATGARIVSRPGARVLRLRRDRGARAVTLTVTPRRAPR